MAELRDRRPERLEEEDVLGGIGEMILAADDMRDRHGGVVHGHREVVERRPVRAHDDQVAAEDARVDLHAPANHVIEDNPAIRWDAEANHGLAPLGLECDALPGGQMGAAAVVAWGLAGGLLALALGIQLMGRAVAVVGLVLRQESIYRLPVSRQALHLAIWAVGAALRLIAHSRSFVPRHPQPVQAVDDVTLERLGGAGLVRILQAQDEGAAGVPCEEEVEERGPGRAQVERPGRARRDANADFGHAPSVRAAAASLTERGSRNADQPARRGLMTFGPWRRAGSPSYISAAGDTLLSDMLLVLARLLFGIPPLMTSRAVTANGMTAEVPDAS